MDKMLIFGLFLKILGYWLSRLSAETQKKKNQKISKKVQKRKEKRKYWRLAEKMCLSSVYYSKFGCFGS
jgi:hypothetical protein